MMQRVLDNAAAVGTPVVRWCLLDVLQRCPPQRDCTTCPLLPECGGAAKNARGFVPIDDAIQMKRRVSKETWDCEMLCRRPGVRGRVYPAFDPDVHLVDDAPAGPIELSIDFGFAAPFVALWLVVHDGGVTVIDEYAQAQRTLDEHLDAIEARGHPRPRRVTCDPAGAARSGQTARSDVQVLRHRGYRVAHRPSRIVDGLELVRRHLRSADGAVRLRVHRRCRRLTDSLLGYRYPANGGELPLKDGGARPRGRRAALLVRQRRAADRRGAAVLRDAQP